jgi:hypothetical protein
LAVAGASLVALGLGETALVRGHRRCPFLAGAARRGACAAPSAALRAAIIQADRCRVGCRDIQSKSHATGDRGGRIHRGTVAAARI